MSLLPVNPLLVGSTDLIFVVATLSHRGHWIIHTPKMWMCVPFSHRHMLHHICIHSVDLNSSLLPIAASYAFVISSVSSSIFMKENSCVGLGGGLRHLYIQHLYSPQEWQTVRLAVTVSVFSHHLPYNAVL